MKRKHNLLLALVSSLIVVGTSYAADSKTKDASSSYVAPKMQHAAYGDLKIVVPLTTDDKAIHTMKLRNLENSLESGTQWDGHIHNTVVLYSKGVSLLKNPDAETRQKIDMLKTKGVKFVVCNNSLIEQGIDFHQLYNVTDSDIVPSGFAEVAYLQTQQKYAVDPIN